MSIARSILWVLLWLAAGSSASAQECVFGGDPAQCGKLGCRATVDEPERGDSGTCAPCENDAQCGGTRCDPGTGTCEGAADGASPAAATPIVVIPEPWYPHYHLGIVDVAFDIENRSEGDVALTFGSGYWFRGAFRKVGVQPAADGLPGWESPDPPAWFFHGGAALAIVSSAQNIFAEAALYHYTPAGPIAITGYTFGALYQRQGASIWKVTDSNENSNRVGPAVGVEFLHNITLRVSYELPVSGPMDYPSLMVSLVYMKSLVSDLVPENYQRFVPSYL